MAKNSERPLGVKIKAKDKENRKKAKGGVGRVDAVDGVSGIGAIDAIGGVRGIGSIDGKDEVSGIGTEHKIGDIYEVGGKGELNDTEAISNSVNAASNSAMDNGSLAGAGRVNECDKYVQSPSHPPSQPPSHLSSHPPSNPPTFNPQGHCDGLVIEKKEKRVIAEEVEEENLSYHKAPLLKTLKALSKTRETPSGLSIAHMEDEIVASVKENYITVVTGGTGTGKSTQVPQFLFENGFGDKGKICITQPRRVSTKATAERISFEQKSEVGALCGYKMRYDTKTTEKTQIEVVTEGVLLQELSEDPMLSKYSVILLDEVHERSMVSDTLLLVLGKLVRKTDIRVVLMSATISEGYLERIRRVFRISPNVIRIDPHKFEVQVHFLPVEDYSYLVEMQKRIHRLEEEEGSILAFVSTKEETETIRESVTTARHVYTLHSDTPFADQQEILRSKDALIIATNVAETSLTLPDVRYVIDGGREVSREYSYKDGSYEYRTVPISKSSAGQRLGRTGRVAPGVCYRMYTTVEYEKMNEEKAPEILREKILPTVSSLLKIGVRPDKVKYVEFITPPPVEHIEQELSGLRSIGVVLDRLTEFGRKTLSVPMDPYLAASIVKVSEKHPEDLEYAVDACAMAEIFAHKKIKRKQEVSLGVIRGEVSEAADAGGSSAGGQQPLSYFDLLSYSASADDRVKISKLSCRIRKVLASFGASVRAGSDLSQTLFSASVSGKTVMSCVSSLAWSLRQNLVTLYRGKCYYKETEVYLANPLPHVPSEKPVPIVYHTLTRSGTSKSVYINLLIVHAF